MGRGAMGRVLLGTIGSSIIKVAFLAALAAAFFY